MINCIIWFGFVYVACCVWALINVYWFIAFLSLAPFYIVAKLVWMHWTFTAILEQIVDMRMSENYHILDKLEVIEEKVRLLPNRYRMILIQILNEEYVFMHKNMNEIIDQSTQLDDLNERIKKERKLEIKNENILTKAMVSLGYWRCLQSYQLRDDFERMVPHLEFKTTNLNDFLKEYPGKTEIIKGPHQKSI